MFKITLIALGDKMPAWVEAAVSDYQKRLKDSLHFNLLEIPLIRRGKSADLARILEKENRLIKAALPKEAYYIALDIEGHEFSSHQLADKLAKLQHINHHLCFLIGGPEGLSQALLQDCQERWSLSKLTLPHALARVVFIEALYRGYSILQGHPYHK